MQDIEQCRTAARGGQVYFCQQCQQHRYSYHSCKNRHCPKCGNEQATAWLQAQHHLLLPTHYFLVTFTLPAALRSLARYNQKTIYNLLFRAASQALLQLAQDPRFCGGLIGMVGVLHTWTRALLYHPHVHFIVTGGGWSSEQRWLAARKDFLVPVKALSPIFRAKFREQLHQSDLFQQVPQQVWQQAWVVHSQPIGSGLAAFKYLAPYIFRVALSNQRLIKLNGAALLSSTKIPLPSKSDAQPLRPRSLFGASCNTSCLTASSECATTACFLQLAGDSSRKSGNYFQRLPAN
jgi:hypothetical protein